MKAKHLEKALMQFAEEGAAKVFKPDIGAGFIVGVVGALQFEVLASRIELEYGLPVRFEASQFTSARWVTGPKAALEKFVTANKQHIAHDNDGDPVYLTRLKWDIDRVGARLPGADAVGDQGDARGVSPTAAGQPPRDSPPRLVRHPGRTRSCLCRTACCRPARSLPTRRGPGVSWATGVSCTTKPADWARPDGPHPALDRLRTRFQGPQPQAAMAARALLRALLPRRGGRARGRAPPLRRVSRRRLSTVPCRRSKRANGPVARGLELDRRLHGAAGHAAARRQITHEAPAGTLPDGTFVAPGGRSLAGAERHGSCASRRPATPTAARARPGPSSSSPRPRPSPRSGPDTAPGSTKAPAR